MNVDLVIRRSRKRRPLGTLLVIFLAGFVCGRLTTLYLNHLAPADPAYVVFSSDVDSGYLSGESTITLFIQGSRVVTAPCYSPQPVEDCAWNLGFLWDIDGVQER
jgi:hypothetical protein